MLFGVMKALAWVYYWSWFIWPFVFVGSLLHTIKVTVREGVEPVGAFVAACVSLLIILAGLMWPAFS